MLTTHSAIDVCHHSQYYILHKLCGLQDITETVGFAWVQALVCAGITIFSVVLECPGSHEDGVR